MTKKQLEEYRDIAKEIIALEEDIRNLRKTPPIGTDIVTGSDDEYPYCKRNYTITGVDYKRLDNLINIYRRRIDRLTEQRIEVEKWLDTVEDSIIRQCIRHYFLNALSWKKVAIKIYGKPCEDAPRKAVERYFDKYL